MSAVKEQGKDYTVQAALNVLTVAEFLARGEILEWKSIREVAEATGLTENMAYRLLETLVAKAWAQKSRKGYRQDTVGLMNHLIYAQQYLKPLIEKYGAKN